MPSRRADIAMSPEEIVAYLTSRKRVILTSNGPDGFPHPMPMTYVFRDDRFLMTTFRKSQKVKNLQRDPRCALLVESGERYAELKAVLAYAEAEITDDAAWTHEVMALVGEREAGGDPAELAEKRAVADAMAAKRVVLSFRPHRWVTWDHSKLHGRY